MSLASHKHSLPHRLLRSWLTTSLPSFVFIAFLLEVGFPWLWGWWEPAGNTLRENALIVLGLSVLFAPFDAWRHGKRTTSQLEHDEA
jgi:hypothetical protein